MSADPSPKSKSQARRDRLKKATDGFPFVQAPVETSVEPTVEPKCKFTAEECKKRSCKVHSMKSPTASITIHFDRNDRPERSERKETGDCHKGLGCTFPRCRYVHPEGYVAPSENGPRTCNRGVDCTRFGCTFQHPEGYVAPASSNQCRRGLECTKPGCGFEHPAGHTVPEQKDISTTPCKFGKGCTKADCKYQHEANHTPAKSKCRAKNRCCNEECAYEHPRDVLCTYYPNCGNGDKCQFRHPN